MLQNVYLVPFVLGHHPRRLDIWHGSNWEWPEYAGEIPQALLQFHALETIEPLLERSEPADAQVSSEVW